jgi:hypothetical protein
MAEAAVSDFSDFIDDYHRTWEKTIATADVSPLPRFFHLPCMFVGPDGSVTVASDAAELNRFNQGRLEQFLRDEAPNWLVRSCDSLTLGARGMLVMVNWEGHRVDGTTARAWRQFYSLLRTRRGLRILVSTFSAGSHG